MRQDLPGKGEKADMSDDVSHMHDTAMLIALRNGMPPHAESLTCEDLHGPRSLFGGSAVFPKIPDNAPAACDGGVILWRDTEEQSPARLAEAIAEAAGAEDGQGEQSRMPPLAVPAYTCLTGRSTSTFAVAWAMAEKNLLPEWGAVLSSCQTEGRGQMRRVWHSPRGNLHVTFRLPGDALLKGDAASVVTGYILVMAFRTLGFPLLLKWPNDLLLEEGGKAGGILLEEKKGVLLAGLGVNLAEVPSASLLREGGTVKGALLAPWALRPGLPRTARSVSVGEAPAPFILWRRLVSEAILAYSRAVEGRSLSDLFSPLDSVLAWKGREVIVREGAKVALSGRVLGFGPGGGLRLRLEQGEIRHVFSGSLALAE
jgi:BirA family biotin operon repressor/biotin-[acetyl-CoA-carboxylase] ligase